jgi:phosphatidylglycerophosphatase A
MIARLMLTVFGLGLSPKGPGTVGSLPPVVIALGMVALAAPLWAVDAMLIVLAVVFGWACARYGTQAEQSHGEQDPQFIVADEVAGQVLPLLFLPWAVGGEANAAVWNVALALTAFISFRAFDILKPPPVRNAERIGGGAGILADDLIAGAYAAIATQLIAHFVLPALL